MRDGGGSTSAGTDWTAPNPGGDTVSGASAGSSHVVITCLVCEEKIPTWRGDVRVECQCGGEYHACTAQVVEEPICGLLHVGQTLSAQRNEWETNG